MGKGILKEEEKSFLLIFNDSVYPTVNDSPEENIRKVVNRIVFEDDIPDTRTAMLLTLIYTCDLSKEVFGNEKSKEAKQRIKRMMDNNEYGDAVTQSIKDMESAILMATTMVITTTVIAPNSSN